MNRDALVAFIRRYRFAVEASVSSSQNPQAAVIGIACDDNLEIVFDTLSTSRKCLNLRADPKIALVVGWDPDEACTVQLEGLADEPQGEELARLQRLYFASFPDGRERQTWRDITYFRVRPTWVRFTDFRVDPPKIIELSAI